jgi:hypothetical protein
MRTDGVAIDHGGSGCRRVMKRRPFGHYHPRQSASLRGAWQDSDEAIQSSLCGLLDGYAEPVGVHSRDALAHNDD